MAELVAETYANALFEVGLEQDEIETLFDECKQIRQLLSDYPDLYNILTTPKIANAAKKTVVTDVFGDRISQTMLNFLRILVDKRRSAVVVDIFQAFEERYYKRLNKAKAVVWSVVPLSQQQIQKLTDKLNKMTGQDIEVENKIDPALIGGVVVRIGDRMIDNSVKTGVHNMRDLLIERVV